jgi:hypothetical protein
MQESHLFEYAVIRVMPRVERGEFLNAGVVLYCRDQKFLQIRYKIDEPRILALDPKTDIEEIKCCLESFEQVCKGGKSGGPIGKLPIEERFRWLTATRSTVIQSSKVHPGMCTDAGEMLDKLFGEMVG